MFVKGDLPYGLTPHTVELLHAGADVVLVEGPMDALAVNQAASAGRPWVAIAPNGTALTSGHLAALNRIAPLAGRTIIEAFDSDQAGRTAAFRTFGLLADAGVHDAVSVTGLTGKDPAQMPTDNGTPALTEAIGQQRPLADVVVDEVLSRWPADPDGYRWPETKVNAMREAATHIAAMTSSEQQRQADRLVDVLGVDPVRALSNIAAANPVRTPTDHRTKPTPETPAEPAGLGLPTKPALNSLTAGGNTLLQERTDTALPDPVATIVVDHDMVETADQRVAEPAAEVDVLTEPAAETAVDEVIAPAEPSRSPRPPRRPPPRRHSSTRTSSTPPRPIPRGMSTQPTSSSTTPPLRIPTTCRTVRTDT
ncbi:toprim domain-containing protein [Nakamurella silvestris]|nr:toprim domain-containing protein [Nakamurella silvestris]